MAFFTLEDKTGDIEVSCFTDAYETEQEKIKDGNILLLSGHAKEVKTQDGSEYEFIMEKAEEIKAEKKHILISVKNIEEWIKLQRRMDQYQQANGHPLLVRFELDGVIRKTTLLVSKKILQSSFLTSLI